jgi:hypothetical protein
MSIQWNYANAFLWNVPFGKINFQGFESGVPDKFPLFLTNAREKRTTEG